jgi:5'-nucleotidase
MAKQIQDDAVVWLTFIHMNDIYEMMPVSGGALGGVARVATLKKQLLAKNPNTFLTMAGDLHGPSALGLAIVDGEPLAGKQNIAVMNRVGIDYATFGDHEFDTYSAEAHMQRLAETEFPIISSNVFDATGNPFPNVLVNKVITVSNGAGATVKVGFFGATKPIPRAALPITHVAYAAAATQQVAALAAEVDILIALTHFNAADDCSVVEQHPEIDLILGGDDHQQMKVVPSAKLAPIFKADSNARSVQIIDIYYDTGTGTLRIADRLQPITDAIADDPQVKAEVDKWVQQGYDGFRAKGIEPTEVIATLTVDLDGFANSVRNRPTELTRLMVQGIHNTATDPELSFMFSALIRLDDKLPAGGNFTMYDVIRTFPNNYDVVTIDLPGTALKFVLDFGQNAKGSGQYLLSTPNVTQTETQQWLINGQPLEQDRTYRVGTTAEIVRDFTTIGAQLVETHPLTLQQLLVQELTTTFGPVQTLGGSTQSILP